MAEIRVRVIYTSGDSAFARDAKIEVPDNYRFVHGGATFTESEFAELQGMPVADRGQAIVGSAVTRQSGIARGTREALRDYRILMTQANIGAALYSQQAAYDWHRVNQARVTGVPFERINVHSADAQARQEHTAGSSEMVGALMGGVGFGVGSIAISSLGKGIGWLAAKEAARRALIKKGVEWTAGAGFAGMFGYHTVTSGGRNLVEPYTDKVSDVAGLFEVLSGGMYPGPDIPLPSGVARGANRFMGIVAPFGIAMMGKQGWKEFQNRGKPATPNPSLDAPEGRGANELTKALVIEGFGRMGMDISWLIGFQRHANQAEKGFHTIISSLGKIFHGAKEVSPEVGFHESMHTVKNLVPEANTAYFENFSRDFTGQHQTLAGEVHTLYSGSPSKKVPAATHGVESQAFLFAESLMSQTGIPLPLLTGKLATSVRKAFESPGLREFASKELAGLFEMADQYGLGFLRGKTAEQLGVIRANLQKRIRQFKDKGYDTSALETRLSEVKEFAEKGTLPASEQGRLPQDKGYFGFEENLGEGVFREKNDPANITSPRGPTGERPAAPRDLATALGDLGIGLQTSDKKYTSIVRKGRFDKPDKDRIRNQFASIMDNQNPKGNPSREAGIKVIELAELYKRAVEEGRMDDALLIRHEALATIRAAEGIDRPIFGFVDGPGTTRPPAGPRPLPPRRPTGTSGPEPDPKPEAAPPSPNPFIKPFTPDPDFVPEIIPPEIKPPDVVPEVTPEIVPEVKPPEIIPEVKPPEVKPPEVVPEVKPPVPVVPVPVPVPNAPRPGPMIQPGEFLFLFPHYQFPLFLDLNLNKLPLPILIFRVLINLLDIGCPLLPLFILDNGPIRVI